MKSKPNKSLTANSEQSKTSERCVQAQQAEKQEKEREIEASLQFRSTEAGQFVQFEMRIGTHCPWL